MAKIYDLTKKVSDPNYKPVSLYEKLVEERRKILVDDKARMKWEKKAEERRRKYQTWVY